MKHTVAGITVDHESRVLLGLDGKVLKVRRQSYDVFVFLVKNANRVVSRTEIMDAVWPDVVVTDDSVSKCVGEIRKILGSNGREILKTIPKRGFYFSVEDPECQHIAVDTVSGNDLKLPLYLLLSAFAAILLLSFGAYKNGLFDRPSIEPAVASKPSLAVMAFDNFSDDPTLNYFGDGFSENIITALSRFPDLAVIARSSSFAFKGKATDIRSIGEELGADYVLIGSVQKQMDKLRLTAQLVETESGTHVWAESFKGENVDPWALQEEVVVRIVDSITGEDGQLKIAEYQRIWGKDNGSLEEYDYYLRGHEMFMKNSTREVLDQAGEIWAQGLRKYPQSSLLRAKLSFYHVWLVWQYWSNDRPKSLQRAVDLAQQALSLPGSTPHTRRSAHWALSLALSMRGDMMQAATEAKAAIAMSPYDRHMVGDLAGIIAMAGNPDEAIPLLEDLKRSDPNFGFYFNLAIAYYLSGNDEKVIETALQYRATSLNRYVLLASSYVRLGQLNEARSAIKTLLEMKPTFSQENLKTTYAYADPSILPLQAADLGKAGLPVN